MTTMLVETYEVPEVAGIDGERESDAEAIELIDRLGLNGQKALVNRDSGERFPYRPMTDAERKIYNVLLPKQTNIKEYKEAPIPLRVLQIAAHASTVKMDGGIAFSEIQVWSAKSAEVKDQILVGKHGSTYDYTLYLLARWGEVLLPLDELKKLAIKTRFEEIRSAAAKIAAQAQAKLASLVECDDVLGETVPYAYYLT